MTQVANVAPVCMPARAAPQLTLARLPQPGERAQRLFAEARSVSREHVAALSAAIAATSDLAQAIVEAGDLYAPGLQHFAGRLAEELFWRGKALGALLEREAAAARFAHGRCAS